MSAPGYAAEIRLELVDLRTAQDHQRSLHQSLSLNDIVYSLPFFFKFRVKPIFFIRSLDMPLKSINRTYLNYRIHVQKYLYLLATSRNIRHFLSINDHTVSMMNNLQIKQCISIYQEVKRERRKSSLHVSLEEEEEEAIEMKTAMRIKSVRALYNYFLANPFP